MNTNLLLFQHSNKTLYVSSTQQFQNVLKVVNTLFYAWHVITKMVIYSITDIALNSTIDNFESIILLITSISTLFDIESMWFENR